MEKAKMKIQIIAATDKNWLIGKGDKLPWNIKSDMSWFKSETINHPIIMGRKTWNSLPKKPLKDRINIVVSRTFMSRPGATSVNTLEDGISFAMLHDNLCNIIGGAEVYKYALENNLVDSMLISRINGDYEGDIYFPKFDESKWTKTVVKTFPDFEVVEYGFNR